MNGRLARIESLDDDLAKWVLEDGYDLVEAELVQRKRGERIARWVADLNDALDGFEGAAAAPDVLLRMAGSPIPDRIAEELGPERTAMLAAACDEIVASYELRPGDRVRFDLGGGPLAPRPRLISEASGTVVSVGPMEGTRLGVTVRWDEATTVEDSAVLTRAEA